MRERQMYFRFSRSEMTLREKLWHVSWSFVLLITVVCSVGFLTLYSAANGNIDPWASRQIVRFLVGMVVMLAVSMVDIRVWMRWAYLLYAVALLLLMAVEIRGSVGMGAQRWIDLGFIQLQPSEIMKITLVLALARYFHGASYQDVGRPLFLIPPVIMVFLPVGLVLKQPDLGTAMMLTLGSGAMFFLAGVRVWKFAVIIAAGVGAVPVAWKFMREYQRQRIITFLNPENDPLGAGYHILQSKIALGSGGMFGKGFMLGTQSHLNFLPEKQTDFIFTMLAEEWGMVGGLVLVALYTLILVYGYAMSLRARSQFARLVGLGLTTTFFLYVFINIAMVMGIVPVVGVPLPLISYGGTAMLTLLFGFGLIMSVYIHRDVHIGRRGASDDI
ncbi:rod shape-determining protein RodA [Telmatospirillum sp.]|uniref:rod shape-determining protein RodA n=1 Tax=Telmatospirillum sp. TaxID=2079197 RepID=UPI00284465CD|nr:rod shape-determining protein RodA [Telmatospirillum sp.]MDR3437658.1 rod shape-determining protein RodA [Telmatospirillum sp.]